MVDFLNHYMKPSEPVDPGHLRALPGVGDIINVLSYLLCDPGDGILVPSPYFAGFDFLVSAQAADAIIIPVDLRSKQGPDDTYEFELTTEKLETSYEKSVNENICIRALLLTNPHNPLGDVYSEKLLRDCLAFAHRHSLHVIVDEVYMLSIFEDGHPPMKNALSLKNIPDKEHLHVVWGFSKDFGLSGIPSAVIHSQNKDVLCGLDKISDLHNIPSITQLQLTSIVSDLDWLDNVFIPTNHSRLRECHGIVCEFLQKMKIPFLKRGSGLYVWVYFGEFVSPLTREGEIAFCQKLLGEGLFINPGCDFHCTDPGWFRIIFSKPIDTLKVALGRFEQVIGNFRKLKM